MSWLLVAGVHGALLGWATADRPLAWQERIQLHDFAMSQIAAMGVLSAAVVFLWKRMPWRRRWLDLAALVVACSAMAVPLLEDDLSNVAVSRGDASMTWQLAGGLAIGLACAAVVAIGALFARPRWRWLGVAAGLSIPLFTYDQLAGDYRSLHFFATWIGALCAGASLVSTEMPLRVGLRSRAVVLCLLAAVSAASLVTRPGDRVWALLVSSEGSLIAPITAAMFEPDDEVPPPPAVVASTEKAGAAPDPWLSPRNGLRPIPPSGKRLIDDDGIVLLLTIDALRADVVLREKHRDHVPTLSMLAREGVSFLNARAPSPSTMTTFVSLMLGKYYSQLYWTQSGKAKDPKLRKTWGVTDDPTRSFAEELADAGVHTAQVVGVHSALYELAGVRGFGEEIRLEQYAPAPEIADRVIAELREHGKQGLFLYTHFIEPHAPYKGDKSLAPFDRYLGEVASVDEQIGRIVAFLKDNGMWQRTTLIVSSDHGEAFGERGLRYHATTVYDVMLRVPLIVSTPKREHREVETPVSLIDIGPTLLDMYGLPTPGHNMGQSLAPFIRGEPVELTRPIAADSGRHMQALYFTDGMKAIRDRRRKTQELYDLTADPDELDNLAGEAPDARQRLGQLNAFFAAHAFRKRGYKLPWRRF